MKLRRANIDNKNILEDEFNNKDALLLKRKEENREIQVKLFEDNKHIVISIKDNAYGIDQEIIDKIFKSSTIHVTLVSL